MRKALFLFAELSAEAKPSSLRLPRRVSASISSEQLLLCPIWRTLSQQLVTGSYFCLCSRCLCDLCAQVALSHCPTCLLELPGDGRASLPRSDGVMAAPSAICRRVGLLFFDRRYERFSMRVIQPAAPRDSHQRFGTQRRLGTFYSASSDELCPCIDGKVCVCTAERRLVLFSSFRGVTFSAKRCIVRCCENWRGSLGNNGLTVLEDDECGDEFISPSRLLKMEQFGAIFSGVTQPIHTLLAIALLSVEFCAVVDYALWMQLNQCCSVRFFVECLFFRFVLPHFCALLFIEIFAIKNLGAISQELPLRLALRPVHLAFAAWS